MKILVINCGSSSLKYQVIDSESEDVLAKGLCERIGIGGVLEYTPKGGEKEITEMELPTHTEAVAAVLKALTNEATGVLKSLDEIEAVGHRVVHGGENFSEAALINEDMIKAVEDCNDLAPLHNPANIIGIRACQEVLPNVPMVGVFDTAFHQTMPAKAYLYGIPKKYYDEYKVRRYGFHGTSHQFVSQRAAELIGKPLEESKIIVCHLGNGASISAVENGKSIDTSMGLTPLAGVMMATRSGDIDASVVDHLIENLGYDMKTVFKMLNKESGLLGVSGVSGDMRDIIDAKDAGNQRAELAFNMFRKRVADYIGSYFVELGHVDAISFTAGIGENSFIAREAIIDLVKEALGIVLDDKANVEGHGERLISAPESKIKVFVVPTDEELVIARDTKELLNL